MNLEQEHVVKIVKEYVSKNMNVPVEFRTYGTNDMMMDIVIGCNDCELIRENLIELAKIVADYVGDEAIYGEVEELRYCFGNSRGDSFDAEDGTWMIWVQEENGFFPEYVHAEQQQQPLCS